MFLCRLANDRKLSLATLLDTYDDTEINLWLAYDIVHGLDDVHSDAAWTRLVISQAFTGKGKYSDFTHRKVKKAVQPQQDIIARFKRQYAAVQAGIPLTNTT